MSRIYCNQESGTITQTRRKTMKQDTAYKTDLYKTISENRYEYFYCPGCDVVYKYDEASEINIFICWYSEMTWDFELKSINCGCSE